MIFGSLFLRKIWAVFTAKLVVNVDSEWGKSRFRGSRFQNFPGDTQWSRTPNFKHLPTPLNIIIASAVSTMKNEADNLELVAVFIIYTGEFEAALLDSLKKICATK